MLVHHLFENTLIPKKVLAVVLVRFFKDLHFAMQAYMKNEVEGGDGVGFGNELNVDTSQPDMRLLLDFPVKTMKPPTIALKKIMNDLARKYKVYPFGPKMTFEREGASLGSFNFWVNITFQENLELDDAALDAAWEEVKRLGLNQNVTTDGLTNSLTVNG